MEILIIPATISAIILSAYYLFWSVWPRKKVVGNTLVSTDLWKKIGLKNMMLNDPFGEDAMGWTIVGLTSLIWIATSILHTNPKKGTFLYNFGNMYIYASMSVIFFLLQFLAVSVWWDSLHPLA
jgi:hypothetical protein